MSSSCPEEALTFFAEPRYASLPNIMKAKKKPIQKLTPGELEVDLAPTLETLKVAEPPKRVGGAKVSRRSSKRVHGLIHFLLQVENVDELIAKLKEAGITAVKA